MQVSPQNLALSVFITINLFPVILLDACGVIYNMLLKKLCINLQPSTHFFLYLTVIKFVIFKLLGSGDFRALKDAERENTGLCNATFQHVL